MIRITHALMAAALLTAVISFAALFRLEQSLIDPKPEIVDKISFYAVESEEDIRRAQIQNYRDGKALLVNVHFTHTGGTTFCNHCKTIGPTPTHACNSGNNWDFTTPDPNDLPWTHDQTSEYIPIVRRHFHMIGWEFDEKPTPRPLLETDWENPLLVSVLIVKDPIDRLLSGGPRIHNQWGKVAKVKGVEKPDKHWKRGKWSIRTQAQWWSYAHSRYTDNFALDKLTPESCRQGETSLECLGAAKDLVKRFTFIIDIFCLDESMNILADRLGWNPIAVEPHTRRADAAARIGNSTLHEFLKRRNRRDIELYNWAKDRAILDCSELS